MDRRLDRPTLPWWRQSRFLFGIGAVAMLLLLMRFLPASGSTDMSADDLAITSVQSGKFDDFIPLRSTVAPQTTTLVSAITGGQIEQLLVQDGMQVRAGQPLAILVNPELKLDVLTRDAAITSQLGQTTAAEVSIERSRGDRADQIDAANYDLIKAKRELGVRQKLHDLGVVSDAGVRSYQEEFDYRAARVKQLRSNEVIESRAMKVQLSRLAQERAQLLANRAAVRSSLDALVIRAPLSGRLTNFIPKIGQMIKPGDVVGQIDSENNWILTADVDEYYIGRVAVGQSAIAANAKLTVSRVLPNVANGRFRVELNFIGAPPSDLSRGQAIDARITLGGGSNALLAPVGPWLDSGGGTSAFVLDNDGRHARRRQIRIGKRNPEYVEVLSGLPSDARIVTASTANVKGDIINIK
ncbi:MAG: biotin/lipoyl-binding protein [Novosphingobium sp.]|nr:biotin/lipoyl-binding protein [Novosphingobium sp.]